MSSHIGASDDIFAGFMPPRIKVFLCTIFEILVSRYQLSEERGASVCSSLWQSHLERPHSKHVHFVIYVIKMLLAACPSQTGSLHFKFYAADVLIQSCMPIAHRLTAFLFYAVDALIQIQEACPSKRSVVPVEARHQHRKRGISIGSVASA